jgi:hypothetical protein
MIDMNQANTEQHRQGTLAPAFVLRNILARENHGKTSTSSLAITVEVFVQPIEAQGVIDNGLCTPTKLHIWTLMEADAETGGEVKMEKTVVAVRMSLMQVNVLQLR